MTAPTSDGRRWKCGACNTDVLDTDATWHKTLGVITARCRKCSEAKS